MNNRQYADEAGEEHRHLGSQMVLLPYVLFSNIYVFVP